MKEGSNNQVIFQTSNLDGKVYIREQTGFFQKVRRYLSTALMMTFILLPFIQYQGKQAILFDIGAQKLHLFSLILHPQDLLIFVYLFIFAAFVLFYVSSRNGRIWCGYLCPQTIWSFLFFWVQFRVEGNYQAQKRLDKLPFSIPFIVKKIIKHSIWLVISFFTATTFMAYFYPVHTLYQEIITGQLAFIYWAWIATFMGCTYVNAGWIKEKMCEHICPYSRFQSVMITPSTKQITYDNSRGEPRAPRKKGAAVTDQLGDCVDCNLCVQVCPVGIDIRQGFQYECISCGLCIDACDKVMSQFNYPTGLISYKGESEQTSKRSYSYVLLFIVCVGLMFSWFNNRSEFELTVSKDRNVLYRILDDGRVENTFELKLINKSLNKQVFAVGLLGLNNFEVTSEKQFTIKGDSKQTYLVTVASPQNYQGKPVKFELLLTSNSNQIKQQTVFHSGTYFSKNLIP